MMTTPTPSISVAWSATPALTTSRRLSNGQDTIAYARLRSIDFNRVLGEARSSHTKDFPAEHLALLMHRVDELAELRRIPDAELNSKHAITDGTCVAGVWMKHILRPVLSL